MSDAPPRGVPPVGGAPLEPAPTGDPLPDDEPTLRNGVGWSLFALVASKLVSFVALLVLARILVPDEFGVVAAITTYLAFLEIASDLGVKAVVIYEQERDHSARVQTAFSLNLIVVAVATLIGIGLSWPVSAFFGLEDRHWLFLLGVFSLTCTGVSNIHDGLLLRELSLGRRVRPQLARGVVQAIVSIALAAAGLGAAAMVVGVVCGSLAWTLLLWSMTTFRPDFTLDRAIARSMVAYASGAWLFFVTSWLSIQADVLVVGHQLSTVDLGVYTMAYRLPELLVFNVAWTLSIVAFPALARERKRTDSDVVASTVGLIGWLALYALPIAATLAVLGQPIVDVLFSSRWSASGPVLSGVALAVAMLTVMTPISDAAKAVGRQWSMVVIYAAHVPLVVAAVLIASDRGPEAVAWASVAATIVFVVALLAWAHVALGITIGRVAAALRAPLAAVAGVCAVALPLRLLLQGDVPAVVLLVLGGLGAGAGALLALRVLVPGTLTAVAGEAGVGDVVARLRGRRSRAA
ncbi:oligosaccharide flippase family protein [Patulibacter sp.]|uniref:oligosaccharide flippase family protein n=1 Tax=Patulibacter sp. TaxID=1912859 RepID=UPI0027167898|nr:oligosaccharide flippase family protein [Patulibacter sp.]MDO9407226.1 oligosaccharide flippase family protein [Patulibacter sp.]